VAKATLKDVSAKLKPATEAETQEPSVERSRLTVKISTEVIERARDLAYWDPEWTVAGLVEHGLETELNRFDRKRGEPYPPRKGELKRGRPIR